MIRKRLALVAVALLLVLGIGWGGVHWAMFQVPAFYANALAEVPPDPAIRKKAARQFVQHTLDLVDSLQNSERWSETFEQDEINSWLVEELHNPKYAGLVPRSVSEPRVLLRDEQILIGFRVTQKRWEGVVSLRLRPWVPEPNQLALEVQSVKVGLIPYPLDDLLEDISVQLASEGIRSEWREMDGNDVLVVHLERGESGKSPVLETIEVADGAIRISGRGRITRSAMRLSMLGLANQRVRR